MKARWTGPNCFPVPNLGEENAVGAWLQRPRHFFPPLGQFLPVQSPGYLPLGAGGFQEEGLGGPGGLGVKAEDVAVGGKFDGELCRGWPGRRFSGGRMLGGPARGAVARWKDPPA